MLPGSLTLLLNNATSFISFHRTRASETQRNLTNRFALAGVFVLLLGALQPSYGTTIDFEGLSDGDAVTTQFAANGVTFSNAGVLTAGVSLNEFEFPPMSGINVAVDDGGPLTLTFSVPIQSVGGFFTYLVPITLSAFDANGNLLGSVTSAFFSNLALSGDPGSSPNELLQLAGLGNIATVTISGDPAGFSFVVDDVQFSDVPEPGTMMLTGSVLAFLAIQRLSQVRRLYKGRR